jgi:hypothetical protein
MLSSSQQQVSRKIQVKQSWNYDGVIMKLMKMIENGGFAEGCHWIQVK